MLKNEVVKPFASDPPPLEVVPRTAPWGPSALGQIPEPPRIQNPNNRGQDRGLHPNQSRSRHPWKTVGSREQSTKVLLGCSCKETCLFAHVSCKRHSGRDILPLSRVRNCSIFLFVQRDISLYAMSHGEFSKVPMAARDIFVSCKRHSECLFSLDSNLKRQQNVSLKRHRPLGASCKRQKEETCLFARTP